MKARSARLPRKSVPKAENVIPTKTAKAVKNAKATPVSACATGIPVNRAFVWTKETDLIPVWNVPATNNAKLRKSAWTTLAFHRARASRAPTGNARRMPITAMTVRDAPLTANVRRAIPVQAGNASLHRIRARELPAPEAEPVQTATAFVRRELGTDLRAMSTRAPE